MSDLPTTEYVSAHEVKFADIASRQPSDNALLLDVRRPDELKETGRIPGSRNVALQELDEALALTADQFRARYGFSRPSPGDEITVTCRSGRRVQMAVPVLQKHGYENLKLYIGSFLDWQAQGGEIASD